MSLKYQKQFLNIFINNTRNTREKADAEIRKEKNNKEIKAISKVYKVLEIASESKIGLGEEADFFATWKSKKNAVPIKQPRRHWQDPTKLAPTECQSNTL